MKVYIAGPITNMPGQNLIVFEWVARHLRKNGHTPIIPHNIPPLSHAGECPEAETYPGVTIGPETDVHGGLCYLRADLVEMLNCEAVVVLPGWSLSRGALVEIATAQSVGIPVTYWWPDIEECRDRPTPTDVAPAWGPLIERN